VKAMDLGLHGKTVLITGGSRGIGRACAEVFAQEGCHLRLAARTPEHLTAAADEVRGRYNVNVETYAIDLATSAGVEQMSASQY